MKKLLSVFLTIVMLALPMAEMTAFAAPSLADVADTAEEDFVEADIAETFAEDSGYYGGNISWTLDESGKLTISGSGAMQSAWYYDAYPWNQYRSSINSVVINEGVTSISDYAFYNCNITEVTIPDSVTEIGHMSFSKCSSLENVTIGSGVSYIDEGAFSQSDAMKYIKVDEDNETYSSDINGVLYNKDKTELIKHPAGNIRNSFVIPDSVIIVGQESFINSKNLKSIIIPEGVEHIDYWAFASCTGIEYIDIPETVVFIGSNAFSGCSGLTSIDIPDAVHRLGVSVFYNCEALESVTIGSGVKLIEEYCFYGCTSLESITVDADNEYYCNDNCGALYNKDKTELVQYPLGNSRTYYKVADGTKKICDSVFENSALEEIELPDTLEYIGQYAFSETELELDKSNWEGDVLYIGEYLICADSEALSGNYTVKNGTKLIATGAFDNCYMLTGVEIPDGVEYINDRAFYCTALTSVDIPDSVKDIGVAVFEFCNSLADISIGNGVEHIGQDLVVYTAFYNDESNWEDDMLYIDEYLVESNYGISGEKEVKSGTRLIADGAFRWRFGLTKLIIPEEVLYIGESVFETCDDLVIHGYTSSSAELYAQENDIPFVSIGIAGYFVTYDANGGSGAPEKQTKEPDVALTLSTQKPTRSGYTFKGWTTTLGGSVEYAPGAKYTANKTVTLYAVWQSNVNIPDEYETGVEIVDGVMEAPGLYVKALGDRKLTVTLSGISIKDKYRVNRSSTEMWDSEFDWNVEIRSDSDISYSVSTSFWAEEPGLNNEITIDEMQHSVWRETEDGGSFITDADMTHTSDSITWVFTILEEDYEGAECPFDFSETTEFNVRVYDVDDTYISRVYYVGGEIEDLVLADRVEFAPLSTTSLAVGKTLTLNATASCKNGSKPESTKVIYEIVSGEEYAVIDAKGILKGISGGEVVVRATAEMGTETAFAEITIKVCVPATKVTLSATKASMVVGGKALCLEAVMTPANSTDSLTWESDDEEIATVDENGVVTAHKAGKVKITAIAGSGKKATCSVTIGAPADTVEFTSLKSTSLAVGKTLSLKAKAYCADGTKPVSTNVVFEIVEGEEYATIDAKGKLKGVATGKVTVRATAEAGTETAFADVVINVCIPATKVTLDKTKASMVKGGEPLCLEATVAPENHTDKLTWESSDEEIATVDEYGVVTAHKAGKVKITAIAGSGKKATCSVTIGAPADTVEFTSLKSTSLAVGKTLSLKAKAYCADGTKPVSTNVAFEIVEGEEFATIDAKGKLKGVATGKVTVRATAEAGTETAFADVVINVCIPATKVTLSATKASMVVGGKALCLEAVMTPANSTDSLTWESDDEEIATVDENGVVTAHKAGKVKITAIAGSGKKATCSVTIGAPADTVEFTGLKSTSLAVGKTLSLKAKAYCADGTKPVSTSVVFEIVEGEEFATIDAKGKLKGVATGKVTVRATAEAGTETAFADVVINVCIPATKVTLNKTKATVTAGEKVYLEATLSPENHTDTLAWSSSDEDVATVDKEGVVTTLKEGSVKITATSGSGKKATCTIKVEKKDLTAALPELILENIVYEYFEEDFIIESNPGAVGGMHISATVVGPDEVRAVLIAEWGTDIREMSLKQIKERAIWYADMWKNSGLSFNEDRKLPFWFGNSHPVDADELGRNHQVLLVGLDAECNAVGYYILDGYVPAQ